MRILYCRVGWMNSYNGMLSDSITNGGSYNKSNIGHEVYNFRNHNGFYYGFVQAKSDTINITRIDKINNANRIEDVTVVWIATNKKLGGQRIVGWYKDATVFSKLQDLNISDLQNREIQEMKSYNIVSSNVTLVPESERSFLLYGMGESNVWYGNQETNEKVSTYIENFDNDTIEYIKSIEEQTDLFVGYEKNIVTKARINQGKFRQQLLKKYKHKCCICNQDCSELLIASHIKPWRDSDKIEKVNVNNGLLLCPNHDKLFDLGLISFSDDGNILISDSLTQFQKILSNVAEDMSIEITQDNIPFIKYHREKIFKK